MNYRTLGKTGLRVSEIGFGGWAIGGSMWGGPRDRDARDALERAVELGVNFIDTALVYGMGHSEQLVGQFVRSHPAAGIVVATKVPPKTMRWPAGKGARLADVFPAAWITRCCDDSLKHLGLPRIDLLQLHVWEDAWTDDDSWYEAMVRLRDAGKIAHIGISINSHEPESALRVVRSGRVDALQVIHNIFEQRPEDELFPLCQEMGVGILARVPLDEGSLTGKLRHDTRFPAGDFRSTYFGGDKLRQTVERVEALRPVLDGEAASLVRGALRFCLSHPAVSTVIPGIRSPAQAEENTAASGDGPLPPPVLAALRAHRWDRAAD